MAERLKLVDFVAQNDDVSVNDFSERAQNRINDALADLTNSGGPPNPGGAGNIIVSKDRDSNEEGIYSSIQSAIGDAESGDTIFVESGTYEERPVIDQTDGLTVRGTDDGVVIDASDDSDFTNAYGFEVNTNGVTLENFTLNGPVQPPGAESYPSSYFGLKISDCQNITVENVTVEGSSLSEIDLNSVTQATLKQVTADGKNDNESTTGGTGIFLTNCEDVRLEDVTTRNNDWGGIGISAWSGYPRPDPAARDIRLKGKNTIEDLPILYTEEENKSSPYHTNNQRDSTIDTDGDNDWDVKFPLDGSPSSNHNVTSATIDTGGSTDSLSHTLVYQRSDGQVAELYYTNKNDRDSAESELENAESPPFTYTILTTDTM